MVKKVSISLPDDLHKQLKIKAAHDNTTITSLVTKAVEGIFTNLQPAPPSPSPLPIVKSEQESAAAQIGQESNYWSADIDECPECKRPGSLEYSLDMRGSTKRDTFTVRHLISPKLCVIDGLLEGLNVNRAALSSGVKKLQGSKINLAEFK